MEQQLLRTLKQDGFVLAPDEVDEILRTELLLNDRELRQLGTICKNSMVYQYQLCAEEAHIQDTGYRKVTIVKPYRGHDVCANCGGKI